MTPALTHEEKIEALTIERDSIVRKLERMYDEERAWQRRHPGQPWHRGDTEEIDRLETRWAELESMLDGCQGHPAGPHDHPMGQTVYCDGSCRTY